MEFAEEPNEESKIPHWLSWIKKECDDKEKKKKRGFKYSDAFGGVIGTALCLFLANNLVGWGFPILTSDWETLLRVINITATVTLITWVVLLVLHPKPVFFLGKTLIDVMSVWGMWVTISVFPFDFSVWGGWEWLSAAFQIVLWIGLVVTVGIILVRSARFAIGREFK